MVDNGETNANVVKTKFSNNVSIDDGRKARRAARKTLLKSFRSFKNVPERIVEQLLDGCREVRFDKNTCIVRQGRSSQNFFLLAKGKVQVTLKKDDTKPEIFVRFLLPPAFFGDEVLLCDGRYKANIIADDDKVTCLLINAALIHHLNLTSVLRKARHWYDGDDFALERQSTNTKFNSIKLEDIETVRTIGIGAFGQVDLVQLKTNKSCTFVMKRLLKSLLVRSRWRKSVIMEKQLLLTLNSPFIVKVFKSFSDKLHMYLLMESFLGGDLGTLLARKGRFNHATAQFYIACVVEALDYLHVRNIVHRDIKPQNLLLDNKGYLKLVDFGFAVKLQPGEKLTDACGTAQYMAPELVRAQEHDTSADCWALGILVAQLLTGYTPFGDINYERTYDRICKGLSPTDFEASLSMTARNLIQQLCRKNPQKRLGYMEDGMNGVRRHSWFAHFDWQRLLKRSLKAPFVPVITNTLDMRNFRLPPKRELKRLKQYRTSYEFLSTV